MGAYHMAGTSKKQQEKSKKVEDKAFERFKLERVRSLQRSAWRERIRQDVQACGHLIDRKFIRNILLGKYILFIRPRDYGHNEATCRAERE